MFSAAPLVFVMSALLRTTACWVALYIFKYPSVVAPLMLYCTFSLPLLVTVTPPELMLTLWLLPSPLTVAPPVEKTMLTVRSNSVSAYVPSSLTAMLASSIIVMVSFLHPAKNRTPDKTIIPRGLNVFLILLYMYLSNCKSRHFSPSAK